MALTKVLSSDGTKCEVTFTVSAEAAQGASKINIAGDFNSWSSTDNTLKQNKDGSFSITLELELDREYQFRYLLDGIKWENDWNADKYIPAPYSNADNSVVETKKEGLKKKPAKKTAAKKDSADTKPAAKKSTCKKTK
ncbi:MAG: isoamylase early set domain-containing protein [Treponema sp.]|nr:isoamylase early set domain-containing protein [Treponema sp.]